MLTEAGIISLDLFLPKEDESVVYDLGLKIGYFKEMIKQVGDKDVLNNSIYPMIIRTFGSIPMELMSEEMRRELLGAGLVKNTKYAANMSMYLEDKLNKASGITEAVVALKSAEMLGDERVVRKACSLIQEIYTWLKMTESIELIKEQSLFNETEKELDNIINEIDENKRFALFSRLTRLAEKDSYYSELVNNWAYPQLIRIYNDLPFQFMAKDDILELEIYKRVALSNKTALIESKTSELRDFIEKLEITEVSPRHFKDYIMAFKKAELIMNKELFNRSVGLIERINFYEGREVIKKIRKKPATPLLNELYTQKKIEEINATIQVCTDMFKRNFDPYDNVNEIVDQDIQNFFEVM